MVLAPYFKMRHKNVFYDAFKNFESVCTLLLAKPDEAKDNEKISKADVIKKNFFIFIYAS